MRIVRVVLADDHEVVRAGLRALVDRCQDIQVVGEAANGLEALARARELRPDVVIMDLSMPQLDGIAATERLTREQPGVRVLALTAHEDHGRLARLLAAGAAGYVVKRSAADELIRAIRVVADGGSYVDPILAGTALRVARGGRHSRRAAADGSPAQLSGREAEVLRALALGHSCKQIGVQLGISTKTVETYKARIGEKLGLHGRAEFVRFALEHGWLDPPA